MWIAFAIAASVLWGLVYVVNEKVYDYIRVIPYLAITLLASGLVLLITSLVSGEFFRDLSAVFSSQRLFWLVVAGIVLFVFAELAIGYSIMAKNATVAGLIEISYPIFIVLFSYLLFKENHLTVATAVGGALIFTGIGVIYAFNK